MNLTTTAAHYHNFLHSIFKNMLISKKKWQTVINLDLIMKNNKNPRSCGM